MSGSKEYAWYLYANELSLNPSENQFSIIISLVWERSEGMERGWEHCSQISRETLN
jgi:hypothetical protein